jgi:hypothetical protein
MDIRISKVPASCACLTRFFSLAQSPVLVNSSELMVRRGAAILSVQGSIPVEKCKGDASVNGENAHVE